MRSSSSRLLIATAAAGAAVVVGLLLQRRNNSTLSSASDVPEKLRARYEAAGQAHVFKWLDAGQLTRDAAKALVAQLDSIDLGHVAAVRESALVAEKAGAAALGNAEPLAPSEVDSVLSLPEATLSKWRASGLAAIARGEVCALVMAGGQGTRLGFDGPKGLYDIALPSRKPLFQVFAERIVRLKRLASDVTAGEVGDVSLAASPRLPLYVMTSPLNDAATRAFFAQNGHFGLEPRDVVFFPQGTLPAVALGGDDGTAAAAGALLMESPSSVALAPDGNGGIWRALAKTGALADMEARSVRWVHAFSVDNVACRVADPLFIGQCAARDAQVGNKVVWKNASDEKVGVVARRGGRPAVIEYSEIDAADAARVDPATNKLAFGAGNIANHMFRIDFVRAAAAAPPSALPFHLARKAIAVVDPDDAASFSSKKPAAAKPTAPNGIKLEAFIFDAFALATKQCVLEVRREEEFSPVKNAPGSAADSPDTARAAMLALGARWCAAAGAAVAGAHGVEVSPLVSYAGEGPELHALVRSVAIDASTAAALVEPAD